MTSTELPVADTMTPVLVLRRSFAELQHAVLGIARTLGRLGVPVYAVRTGAREPAIRSRYIRGTLELRERSSDEQWLEALMRFDTDSSPAILLPIDDVSALFAAEYRDRLAGRYVMPDAPDGVHRRLESKRLLYELCQQIGLASPLCQSPTTVDEALMHARAMGYPVVLKRSDPWLAPRDPAAPSVAIVRGPDELLASFRRMESPERPQVIMQEYIPGGSEATWMFNGYFGERSAPVCSFTGYKIRQRGRGTGPTTLGVCVWNERVAAKAARLAAAVDYRGVMDMGFRYDGRDGSYKLLDVNPRIGSTFRLFAADNGLDVVRAAYLDLTGQPIPYARARDGRKWIVEPYDMVASLRDKSRPRAWWRSLGGVEEAAWWARDDPSPFLRMTASLPGLWLDYRARRRRERAALDVALPQVELASPVE